ncbi:hypothetical protein ACHAPT_007335 [Fusarium lateritium]
MDSPILFSDSGSEYFRRSSNIDSDEEPDDAAYGAMLSSGDEKEPSNEVDAPNSRRYPNLCEHCSGLVTYAHSSPLTAYSTTKLLKLSSFQPSCCELCGIFCGALTKLHGHNDMSDWKFLIQFLPGAGFSLSARRFEDVDDSWAANRSGCNLEFYCPDGATCPWGLFSPSKLARVTNPGSSNIYNKAKVFVDGCTASHHCWKASEVPILPSRVLSLGSADDEVRLFEPHGMRAQYICLSHCWGGHQPIQTTRGNLATHLRTMPFGTLPPTYQMAIKFAQAFGIQYVWIDSLCIVQDDADDWARESAKMCDIYGASFLTVAATSSPNCSFDIMKAPAPQAFDFCGETDGQDYRVLACDGIPHPGIATRRDQVVKLWPLLDRAWVMQERLLAPRLLHITRAEMIWECRKQTRCECGIMDSDDEQLWRGPYSKVSHYEALETEHLTQTWHDILQWYTKLSITFHSDRLPALSGLAKQVAARRRVRYVAGMWEDSLPLDLLWQRSLGSLPNVAKANQPQATKPPSWSWASSSWPIIMPLNNLNDNGLEKTTGYIGAVYPSSIAAYAEPATSDPTGNVKNSRLTITGRAFEAVITGWSSTWQAIPNSKPYGWRIEVQSESIPDGINIAYFRQFAQITLDDPAEYQSNQPNRGKVLCMPISRVTRFRDHPREVSETDYALILRERGEEYQRIGLLAEVRDSGLQRHWDRPETLWENRSSCLAALGATKTMRVV